MITLDQFLLANICFFVAAGIFTERAVRLDISRLARFWCVIVIWVLAAIVVLEVKYYGYEKTLAAEEGDLVPANEPTPKTNCGRMQKPNTYILLLGSIVVETDNLPNTVIERGDTKLLWIDKGTDGGISLNFRAYSPAHEVLAEVTDNHFIKNEDALFKEKKNPDQSTLELFNKHDDMVLYVHYYNLHTIAIEGDFRVADQVPVIIPRNETGTYGSSLCVGNSRGAEFHFRN